MTQDEIIEENSTKLRPFFSHQFSVSTTESLPYLKGFGLDYSPKEYYWDTKNRRDSFVVFQYTLSGSGYLATNNKIYELGEQTFFLAELPNSFTYYRGEEEWSFIYIEFSREFFQWLDLPLQIGSFSKEYVNQMLHQLYQLRDSQADIYANSRCAYDLFLTIKAELQTKPNSIEQIKEYIESHYKENLALDELAAIFNLSKYKLIRAFEKNYHQTPINYLNNYRMIQSLRYLREEKTIKEIAEAVGFSDVNYFSRVFKKIIGHTPTSYRKEILKKP
jgi:AraC-like DNA-binding protein